MPGSNPRFLQKARELAADAVIFDLEDAVAPQAKAEARELVVRAVGEGGYGNREVLIRVNGLDTPWGYEDLAAVARSRAHAVVLPKVDDAPIVMQAHTVLRDCGAPQGLRVWCMMETALGVINAAKIASCAPVVGGLIMGTSDLAKELHCASTPCRTPLLGALGSCVVAARAYRLPIIDGVHLDVADDEGFRASCEQGLQLGFDGKTLIHPKTIAVANEVFSPSKEQLEWAREISEAFAAAREQKQGVVLVRGKLVESLHVEEANRLLALAKLIERI